MNINQKLKNLKPYTVEQGDYSIRLDANESYVVPDEFMQEKIAEACKAVSLNRYPDPMAKEVCKLFAKLYDIRENQVTAGNGSDELIGLLISCFLQKGEKLLTFTPDFSMYAFYASLAENFVVSFPKNDDLTIDVDKVLAFLKENPVQMILFSNPCNPTSMGLEREEVIRLISGTDALVILDEAYMDFWDQSLLDCVDDFDNLIVLRTCSKALGGAAMRLGFAVANPTLIQYIRAAKAPYNVNSLTQAAAAVLLSHPETLQKANKALIASRNELYNDLAAMNTSLTIYKTVTNFVFIQTKNASALYEKLLSCGILIRKMGDYLRITAGSPEENKAFLKAFEAICKEELQ